MSKIPFNISAAQQGENALIRITGDIGWDTDAEMFRATVDTLIAGGVKNVHLYINTPGGSCFDAAEIVNIVSRFEGKVTGEGGALVASAGTFIAMCCETFVMPENGMFMIHKPSGYVFGTAAKMESYLKLLTSIEAQYLGIYTTKATDKAELLKQWNAGDWWLTAKEAKTAGFISDVKEKAKIDAATSELITACGCPTSKLPTINNKNDNNMDLRATAQALGLPESATEADVKAAIDAGKKAAADLAAYQAETKRKENEAQAVKIKAEVKAAIDDKRITADVAPTWEKALTADYNTNSVLLASLSAVAKLPVAGGGKTTTNSKVLHQNKTFEELQDDDPAALAELMTDDPKAYDELYSNYVKRNNL